jgi:hypothetical protein
MCIFCEQNITKFPIKYRYVQFWFFISQNILEILTKKYLEKIIKVS